ncbi:MAG: hypothetical protein GY679_04520 [Mycoplasma sp.]|nr:hypothetical protein [Mycoplasma sp.]
MKKIQQTKKITKLNEKTIKKSIIKGYYKSEGANILKQYMLILAKR